MPDNVLNGHVLLTGASGFLGSNLVRRFIRDGHSVTLLLRQSSSLERLQGVPCQIIRLEDNQSIINLLQQSDPIDMIVHTSTCYGRAGESVGQIFSANVAFALQVLDAAIEAKIPQFINTDTVLPRMINAYTLSKAQFAEWGEFLGNIGQISFVNILLEHMYGPGDSCSKFTTMVIRRCLEGGGVLQLTKGEQIRDFIFIEDVLDAYSMIADSSKCRRPGFHEFRVGAGVPVTVRQYVELVRTLSDSDIELKFGALPYRENEVMYSVAETHAIHELGWEPKWELEAGIRETIQQEKLK